MEIRKLRKMGGGGSAGVSIPKKFLEEDGVVGPDGIDGSGYVEIEHAGDGQYIVELVGVDE